MMPNTGAPPNMPDFQNNHYVNQSHLESLHVCLSQISWKLIRGPALVAQATLWPWRSHVCASKLCILSRAQYVDNFLHTPRSIRTRSIIGVCAALQQWRWQELFPNLIGPHFSLLKDKWLRDYGQYSHMEHSSKENATPTIPLCCE